MKPKHGQEGRGRSRKLRAYGVSILEMMVSLSLATILLASLVSLYYDTARGASKAENRFSADREGALIEARMARDFRLVGLLAPADADGDSNDISHDVYLMPWTDSLRQDFEYANTYEVIFTGDVNDDSTTETVRYYRDSETGALQQQVWTWSRDLRQWHGPVTRHLSDAVDFVMFNYFDREGVPVPDPVTYPPGGYTLTVGERARVTAVEITVVTRSQHIENSLPQIITMADGTTWDDKFRRHVERFEIRGRNLSLGT